MKRREKRENRGNDFDPRNQVSISWTLFINSRLPRVCVYGVSIELQLDRFKLNSVVAV